MSRPVPYSSLVLILSLVTAVHANVLSEVARKVEGKARRASMSPTIFL